MTRERKDKRQRENNQKASGQILSIGEAYDRLYERYEQLKEYCKSFLKAMELFPEKVKAFLKKLLEKQEKTKAPKTKNRAEKETARGMTGYKKWKLRLIKRSLAFIR